MIVRVKSAGWATNEKLTSAQMSQVDANASYGLDKRAGQSDTCSSTVTFAGIVFALSTWAWQAGSTLSADGTVNFTSSSIVTFTSSLVTFAGDTSFTAATDFSGATTFSGGTVISSVNFQFAQAAVAPMISPVVNSAASAVGRGLTVAGQSCSGSGSTGGSLTLKGGNGASVAGSVMMMCGGSTVAVFAPARTTFITPVTLGPYAAPFVPLSPSSSITIDLSSGQNFDLGTMSGPTNLVFQNPSNGATYTFIAQQDGAGGHSLTFSYGAFTAITLSNSATTTANKVILGRLTVRQLGAFFYGFITYEAF